MRVFRDEVVSSNSVRAVVLLRGVVVIAAELFPFDDSKSGCERIDLGDVDVA